MANDLLAGLPRIGLGCVTFGREITADASFAMMDHAFAQGVDFFDTAPAYAQGASETIVGRWLQAHRPPAGRAPGRHQGLAALHGGQPP